MKRSKKQKGITLVALIITIIVLLILAVVAIRAVQGDGIIGHAKNARDKYSEAMIEENTMLSNFTDYITGQLTEGWIQNKTEVSNNKTGQKLTVGQTVTNYTAGGKIWKVLGVENGQLLLMSTTNIKDSYELSGSTGEWSAAENRFVAVEKLLNNECENAIVDIGEATSIRSIKVDDINRVTGYNPNKTGDGEVFGKGDINQYENEVTYTLNAEGKVVYSSDVKSGTSDYTKFEMPDGTALTTSSRITAKGNCYLYYPDSLTTNSGGALGISQSSEAYKMLFRNAEDTDNANYWCVSSFIDVGEGRLVWGSYRVYKRACNRLCAVGI